MKRYWRMVALAAGMLLAGCAADDVMVKRQAEMESRLENLLQSNTVVNTQLAELSNELKELQGRVKASSGDIQELKAGQKELRETLSTMHNQKLTAETAASPAAKLEVVNHEAVAKDKDRENGPQDAYMKAYGLYSANSYDQAIEAFTAFIQVYPHSEYAANAQYWIGECHYTQSNLPQALEAFQKVSEQYPQAKKVPDAMLKAAYTLYALRDQEKGRAMLESLVEKYPKSPAAIRARERLSR